MAVNKSMIRAFAFRDERSFKRNFDPTRFISPDEYKRNSDMLKRYGHVGPKILRTTNQKGVSKWFKYAMWIDDDGGKHITLADISNEMRIYETLVESLVVEREGASKVHTVEVDMSGRLRAPTDLDMKIAKERTYGSVERATHTEIAQHLNLENDMCVGRALIRYHRFVKVFSDVNEIMVKTKSGDWAHYILKR